VKRGRITLEAYRELVEGKLRENDLRPGHLAAWFGDLHEAVVDGDTLLCACSREEAAAGRCHRVWLAEQLVAAGWRVVLDGQVLGEDGEAWCCYGAVARGPEHCTCWQPVYDAEQAPVVAQPVVVRSERCVDCACRHESPERRADRGEDAPEMQTSWDGVQRLVRDGQPFYCHQGMRRVVAEVHPDGRRREVGAHAYRPPIAHGKPRKADGTPADICAGWAALRAAHLAEKPSDG
jgi:hypothetical protein